MARCEAERAAADTALNQARREAEERARCHRGQRRHPARGRTAARQRCLAAGEADLGRLPEHGPHSPRKRPDSTGQGRADISVEPGCSATTGRQL